MIETVRLRSGCVGALLGATWAGAQAAESAPASAIGYRPETATGPELLGLVAAVTLTLAIGVAAVWVLRRFMVRAAPAGLPPALSLVGTLGLTPRSRVFLIQTQSGRRFLVAENASAISICACDETDSRAAAVDTATSSEAPPPAAARP
jgi:flagellar biogenesis protein FliO